MILQSDEPVIEEDDDDEDDDEDDDKDEDDAEGNWTFEKLTLCKDFLINLSFLIFLPLCLWLCIIGLLQILLIHMVSFAITRMQEGASGVQLLFPSAFSSQGCFLSDKWLKLLDSLYVIILFILQLEWCRELYVCVCNLIITSKNEFYVFFERHDQ